MQESADVVVAVGLAKGPEEAAADLVADRDDVDGEAILCEGIADFFGIVV